MPVTKRNERFSGLGRQTRILSGVFVLSFALDFKGAAGGSLLQFAMAAVNTLAFILIAANYRFRLPARGGAAFVFWGWLFFLMVGSFAASVSRVPIGQYIRVIYSFALFLEGFLVAWWVIRRSRGESILVDAMTWTAIISFVFAFFWGLYFTGRGLESIRYQILSPLIPFLIAIAGYDLIFARRHQVGAVLVLAATLGVIAISVTRGMLLIVVMVAAAIFSAWLWNVIRGHIAMPRPLLRSFGWSLVVGIVGLGLTILIFPDVSMRWFHRSLGVGRDVTFWTRIAAVVGQWDQLVTHPAAWLFGRGFGESYRYAQIFAPLVFPYVNPERFISPMWYPGEFMWITPIFYSGLLAGTVGVGILIYGAVKAFTILAFLLRKGTWRVVVYRPLWIGILGYYAIMGLSFTANPFIFRMAPLFMGLCLGLFVAVGGKRIQCRVNH